MTAAHCIYAFKNDYGSNVVAHVGRYNINKAPVDDTIYSAVYGLSQYIVHGSYNYLNNDNDIGLTKTSTYITFKYEFILIF
jgi:hypothetical protein